MVDVPVQAVKRTVHSAVTATGNVEFLVRVQ